MPHKQYQAARQAVVAAAAAVEQLRNAPLVPGQTLVHRFTDLDHAKQRLAHAQAALQQLTPTAAPTPRPTNQANPSNPRRRGPHRRAAV